MLREPVLARRRRDGDAPIRVGINESIEQRPGLDLLDVIYIIEFEPKGRQAGQIHEPFRSQTAPQPREIPGGLGMGLLQQ